MFLHRLALVLALALGVAAPLLTRWLAEDTLVTTLFIGLPPRLWWCVAVACAAAVFRVLRARRLLASTLAVVPVVAVAALTWTGTSALDSRVRGPRVAAWNLAKGTLGAQAQLVAGLRALDADVVCVSEAGRYDWIPAFDVERIAHDLGATVVGSGEVRALVRVPLAASREVPLAPGPARRPLVVVDVEKDGRSWRVGCVHLMPRLLNDPASVDLGHARNGSWAEIAHAAREQGRTLLQVLRAARESGEPFDVVAGDWNNQPYGRVIGDVIDSGYLDPFASSDRPTFGQGLRAMRIDQVLVHAAHGVRSATVVDPGGSDHAALVVEFGER